MLKTMLAAIFAMTVLTARGQYVLRGRIIDSSSHQPLQGASVAAGNGVFGKTITDPLGKFYLALKSKPASLNISYIGYKTLQIDPDTASMVIRLAPDILNLKDVTLEVMSSTLSRTISKIDLDLKPVRNTQELLRLVPGLFIAQHAGGGKAEQIFLRGFDCDHGTDVEVSFDGMPVNMVSHAHGQGYADSHFIIAETIQNIDFGAGPYSTQHGNLNTAGYVAFSSFSEIPNSRVQLEAGRFDSYRVLTMIDLLKKNKERQSAYVAADAFYTNGATDHKQDFNRFNLFGKYNLAISKKTQLVATGSTFKSKWDASGQVPSRAIREGLIDRFGSIDPSEGGNTSRTNLDILLTHRFTAGANWENRVYYSRYNFSLYSDFSFFLLDSIHGDEINQAEKRNLLGYHSKLTTTHLLRAGSMVSVYGAGFRDDATDGTGLAHVVKRQFLNFVTFGDIREFNSFVYSDQQINLGKWILDGGLRFDNIHFHYSDRLQSTQLPGQGKSILSPKLNIQYTVNSHVQLYAKAGKGFHSNDTRVVVAELGKEILPAAYGSDLGVMLKPIPHLFINIAAWYLYLQQEFVYEGDDGNIEPSGKTRRTGIDVILRYQFTTSLFANLNLNLTRARAIDQAKGDNYIPLAPTATSTGGIFYRRQEGLNGGLSYRYIAKRPANEDNSIEAKGYFLLDGSINYTRSKYEIGIALENILNVDWNEAQFATTSRLKNETAAMTDLNFTAGTPFFARIRLAVFF